MLEENAARYASWLVEGDMFYEDQRWNEAGTAYEHALALNPEGSAQAWYRLGNVREEQGRDAEALDCFEKAVALEPGHARAWNNLGGARQRLGRPAAIDAYQRSIAADPDLVQPRVNLGRLYSGRGEHDLAADCFRRGLERHPDDPVLIHLADAASGHATRRASAAYVRRLFDDAAPKFEHNLVDTLGYHVPKDLVALALPLLRPGARVIDIGCGTGLVGAALAGMDAQLEGVDLSPRMLVLARARGVYARLHEGDLVEFLGAMDARSAHAVFATDVFLYIGDLEPVFSAAARVLAPGGIFAFSVEELGEGDYRLMPHGHYAQSTTYLRTLAARHGMAEQRMERVALRREGAELVSGWLAVLTAA